MRVLPVVLLVGCVPVLNTPVDTPNDSEWRWDAPDNSWPLVEPPVGLEGEGFGVGQIPDDFRLQDQHGDPVSLWQFYGSVVAIDVSTMWCAPCQALAQGTEETHELFADEGFVYLTVLPENVGGSDPSRDDLELWASSFGITAPIVADPGHDWTAPAVPDGQYPAVFVVDREMKVVRKVNPPTDENLRMVITEAL